MKPLTGLVVLDLTLARAGPTCVRHLADWGADVISVQPPAGAEDLLGSRDGFDYQNLHRNKLAISQNLEIGGPATPPYCAWSPRPTWWSRTCGRR